MDPADFIDDATEALQTFLASFSELRLAPDGPPRMGQDLYSTQASDLEAKWGASIHLGGNAGGRWELCLICNQAAFVAIARDMFALEPDQIPEQSEAADALSEAANVVGGSLKTRIVARHSQSLSLGLPSFRAGDQCLASVHASARAALQRLTGPGTLLWVGLGHQQAFAT